MRRTQILHTDTNGISSNIKFLLSEFCLMQDFVVSLSLWWFWMKTCGGAAYGFVYEYVCMALSAAFIKKGRLDVD